MSIELHTLETKGKKKKRRKARGISAGQGRTAGRGNSGQKSRAGYSQKRGFEGGQNPLFRRVSKRGFKNINRIEYLTVNVEKLNVFENDAIVTRIDLLKVGVIPKKKGPIKVLGNGDLNKKLTIHADKFTKTAQEKIEKAKGSVVINKDN